MDTMHHQDKPQGSRTSALDTALRLRQEGQAGLRGGHHGQLPYDPPAAAPSVAVSHTLVDVLLSCSFRTAQSRNSRRARAVFVLFTAGPGIQVNTH